VYVSGDTVWYEGVAEVARRVIAAPTFSRSAIVPLHFEGWEHFSESRSRVEAAFVGAGLSGRLRWPPPGRPLEL